ncbi:MAG: RrF2 family transcriptional regulator [Gemmatimonadota bacterium]|nr:RrF2 family transcriptional regulator [Gemmatimonadota bacterium]MDH4349809.1 RrF2 family transcriptional regulator [Gemmatimonadota bacterium]MDH5196444.1 RrF2 family transcriptional regulator [Gemmatimonadota bacterium]
MRITTWAEYGLIVAVHLARHGGERPVPAREIAEREGLPPDYVEQILLKLRRAGLVTSVRGAKGGYYLARSPQEISVRDVLEAAENRTFEVNCESYPISANRCNGDGDCSIRPVWRALQHRIDGFLQGVSLADLLVHEADVEEMLAGQAAAGQH